MVLVQEPEGRCRTKWTRQKENKEDRKGPWPYGPGLCRLGDLNELFPGRAWLSSKPCCWFGGVLLLDYPLNSYLGSMSGKMQKRRLWSLENQESRNHHLIEGPQEVQFICQAVHLGLQLHLGHVRRIHILQGIKAGNQKPKRMTHCPSITHRSFLSLCPSSSSLPCPPPNFHSSLSLLKENQSGFLPFSCLDQLNPDALTKYKPYQPGIGVRVEKSHLLNM